MNIPGAARVTDHHTCNLTTGTVPHQGGPVLPPGATDVLTNSMGQARVGDFCVCSGPPDVIVTGAALVLVNGRPAARSEGLTLHGGRIQGGSSDVLIGGPPAGALLGDPVRANSFFMGPQHHVDSCALLAAESIARQAGQSPRTEDQLRVRAMLGGVLTPVLGTVRNEVILTDRGVPASTRLQPTLSDIAQALAEGRAVIVGLDARKLWGANHPQPLGHGVRVTGVEYDAQGNIDSFVVDDTGTGQSMQRVPAGQMQQATTSPGYTSSMTTTNSPVP